MSKIEEKTLKKQSYSLDEQVGYLLRLASQRHAVIFLEQISENLTPTQFSTLMRISEGGELSQNHLGRLASMDVATVKGVVDRLKTKELVQSRSDGSR
jgi:DNA-binding MarR family transcriptional regulator